MRLPASGWQVCWGTARRSGLKIHIAAAAVVERVGERRIGQVAVRVILEEPIVQESLIKNLVAKRIEVARNGNRHRR